MLVLPVAAEFRPDLILVSAGFDAADKDPLGELQDSCIASCVCMFGFGDGAPAEFWPDLILVSAGFDAADKDPLGELQDTHLSLDVWFYGLQVQEAMYRVQQVIYSQLARHACQFCGVCSFDQPASPGHAHDDGIMPLAPAAAVTSSFDQL
jgi:hypothetical protein